MRFVLKRGIPKPRSVRDRSLKRKYGGRKSRAKKQNNKSTSRARRRHHRLKFPAGCSDLRMGASPAERRLLNGGSRPLGGSYDMQAQAMCGRLGGWNEDDGTK